LATGKESASADWMGIRMESEYGWGLHTDPLHILYDLYAFLEDNTYLMQVSSGMIGCGEQDEGTFEGLLCITLSDLVSHAYPVP
jgi:hypothetical protein